MKIFIRADSSFLIGTGHIIRCLTWAQSLRKKGAIVTFICRDLDGNIISLVEEKQFKVIRLSPPKTSFLGPDPYEINRGVALEQEINELSPFIVNERPDWIIVDHYSLPKSWEEAMANLGPKIFAIDDLFRQHHCHALLDQNAFGEREKYLLLTNKEADLFVGPEFALLAPSFYDIHPTYKGSREVKIILIFFGGSDITGETLKTIKVLKTLGADFKFHVVVGRTNKSLDDVTQFCNLNTNFILHVQTTRMAELMEEADLFIGAGGTTTWERCFLGLPSICISTADNQVEIAKKLANIKVHRYLGHWDELTSENLLNSISELIQNQKLRTNYSKNSLSLGIGSKTEEIYNYFEC